MKPESTKNCLLYFLNHLQKTSDKNILFSVQKNYSLLNHSDAKKLFSYVFDSAFISLSQQNELSVTQCISKSVKEVRKKETQYLSLFLTTLLFSFVYMFIYLYHSFEISFFNITSPLSLLLPFFIFIVSSRFVGFSLNTINTLYNYTYYEKDLNKTFDYLEIILDDIVYENVSLTETINLTKTRMKLFKKHILDQFSELNTSYKKHLIQKLYQAIHF